MKRSLLFIPFLFAVIFLSAQSIEISYEGEVLANDDTITFVAELKVGEVIVEISVTNISGKNITTLAKRSIMSTLEGTTNAFCWGVCYAPFIDLGTVVVNMAIGETRDDFSGHLYNPNKVTGETLIMYTVFNEIDPDDSVSFYVKYVIQVGSDAIEVAGKQNIDFTVYPNPVIDYCNVNISNASNIENIHIIDITGRIVKEINLPDGNELSIDLSDLTSGLYYLTINNKISKPVFKQ